MPRELANTKKQILRVAQDDKAHGLSMTPREGLFIRAVRLEVERASA